MVCHNCKEDKPSSEYYTRHRTCKICRARQRLAYRAEVANRPSAVDRERVPRVDTGPIQAWLRERAGGWSNGDIATFCGMNEKTIRRLMSNGRVSLDTVDKVLVAFECSPSVLPTLYPELYKFSQPYEEAA